MYIDEHGEKLIKSAYNAPTLDKVVDNPKTKIDTLVYTLQRELDVKNKHIETQAAQISDLTAALVAAQQTAAAAQALHAASVKQNIEDKEQKQRERGILARIFGKKGE
jgi:L-arabinose isomerase